MKRITYSRYTGEDLGISAEDLMRALADYFLESGFQSQYYGFQEFDPNSLEALKRAIEQALENRDLFDQDQAERMRERLENMTLEDRENLLNRLLQKMADEGYLTIENAQQQEGGEGGTGEPREPRFEITDQSVDFLGFKVNWEHQFAPDLEGFIDFYAR